jgi:hypothetical protein
MILADRKIGSSGQIEILMSHKLRHQEAFFNRNNANVLHITLRAARRPHPSCVLLSTLRNTKPASDESVTAKVAPKHEKKLWNMTVLFQQRESCIRLKQELEQGRHTTRQSNLDLVLKALQSPEDPNEMTAEDL